jgi:ribokinase
MIAHLLGADHVAMVGRTCSEPYNLWRVPIDALKHAGVNTDYVKVLPFEHSGKFPQIALIAVDRQGNNQIYVVPGVNEDFSTDDVSQALPAFKAAYGNNGILALSLELPLETAIHAIRQGNDCGLKVLLDPSGIRPDIDLRELLKQEIFLIKPNEHEMRILTGINVGDLEDAKRAATYLMDHGILNVLITLGGKGAYLISRTTEAIHIPVPMLQFGEARDETGCGDQTMAMLCVCLLEGNGIADAARRAILAGTMQFHRRGIIPISLEEFRSCEARLPRP